MKRDKNIKITTKPILHLKYCEENGLKMFSFVEKLINDKCLPKKVYMMKTNYEKKV
jgi:hypothetical protein